MGRARSILSAWVRFFARIRLGRDYFACSIHSTMGVYSLVAILILLFPFASEIGIERFHGRLPFHQWAVLQPLPAMYNFENKVTIRGEATGKAQENAGPLVFWINHHVHRVTGDGAKRWVGRFRRGSIIYESTYRGVFVRTVYDVSTDQDGVNHVRRRVEPGP